MATVRTITVKLTDKQYTALFAAVLEQTEALRDRGSTTELRQLNAGWDKIQAAWAARGLGSRYTPV